jgi:hypothetical protein
MADEPTSMTTCGGCGAEYDASDPAEAQVHAAHSDEVKIEQA